MAYVSVPLVYDTRTLAADQFVFIQPTAHFGGLIFGSDIDGRQMRGKGICIVTFFMTEHSFV